MEPVEVIANPPADDAVDDHVPDLVPARMVNELSYCPRLFSLEWVESQFAHNDDVVDGQYRHRVVDVPAGSAPLAADGDLRAARSVRLSSIDLGLVAVVDVVEGEGSGDDKEVHPVDVKRGRPAPTPERAWEPERVQLCVQGLLLREAGYRCRSGFLSFAEARERVEVVFDDHLVDRTLTLVRELREAARQPTAPPPLVASPKCPRCSLVGICLPDEVHALAATAETADHGDRHRTTPVRHLLPSDSAARPLYVTEQGARVGFRSGRVTVDADRTELASVRAIDVSQLCLFGNVQVSSQAVRELLRREVPVCWFSYGGWFAGIAEGLPSRHVELRRRQVARAHSGALDIARPIVAGKVRNCRTLLRRNAKPDAGHDVGRVVDALKRLSEQARDQRSPGSLLGVEGAAARLYFEALPAMLRTDRSLPGGPFHFDGRNRRPPQDPINCLLSYLYALLVKDLTVTLLAVGFDPYLGFYHRPRFGRPALALDMAEELRPLVGDSVVINLVNNGEIRPPHFVVRAGGVALTPEGRKVVLAGYERRLATEVRHPVFGYQVTYRRVMEVQARLLGAYLLGEVPEYVPFVTR
ncbi:MAG TPA: CRISPR-associated endonuclease Cas1 [Acidimicrobiales bacterium]|nr:CRISPR-associated endonuclease Cas1 [Acidimicrobiales bacterium]